MRLARIGCLLLGLALGNTLFANTRIEVLGAVPAPGEKEIVEACAWATCSGSCELIR